MKICYTNRGLLMLTREEIQMSEQQFTDFFDPEIQKIVSEDGCSIYRIIAGRDVLNANLLMEIISMSVLAILQLTA